MKHLNFLWIIAFLFMTGMVLQSCSSDENEDVKPSDEQYFDVSLALDGINVSEVPLSGKSSDNSRKAPLSMANADDLKTVYKITVYYDYKSDGNVNYKYAEGTFDNVGDMQLSMLAGHKYRFICSIWKEVTGNVFLSWFSGYGRSNDITNKFDIVQSSSYTSSLIPSNYTHSGISSSFGYETYRRDLTRYYGELSDYTPTQNGTAIIKMVESSRYGLHVTIEPPSEGKLTVSTDKYYYYYYLNSPSSSSRYVSQTLTNEFQKYDDGGIQFIVGENVMTHWSDVLYGKTINQNLFDVVFTISWTNYNEAGVQIGNSTTQKTITLKRDVMTNVNIDLNINNADTNNAKIGFTYDSKDMSTSGENWTVNVNNDGTMDVTVIPL